MSYMREKGTRDDPVDLDPAPKVYVRPARPSERRQSGRARNAIPANADIIALDSDNEPETSGPSRDAIPIITLDSDDGHDDDSSVLPQGQRLTTGNVSRPAPSRKRPVPEIVTLDEGSETPASQRRGLRADKVDGEQFEGQNACVTHQADRVGKESSVVQGSTAPKRLGSRTADNVQHPTAAPASPSNPRVDAAPKDSVGRIQLSSTLRKDPSASRRPSNTLDENSPALRRQALATSPLPTQLGEIDQTHSQDGAQGVVAPSSRSPKDMVTEPLDHHNVLPAQHQAVRVRTPIENATDKSEIVTMDRVNTTPDSVRAGNGPNDPSVNMQIRTRDTHTQVGTMINEKQRARKTATPRGDPPPRHRRLKRRSELPQQVTTQLQAERSSDATPGSVSPKVPSPPRSSSNPSRTVGIEEANEQMDATTSADIDVTIPQSPVMPDPQSQDGVPTQVSPPQKLIIPTYDIARARLTVKTCLERHLHKRREAHAYVTSSVLWRQRTCQETEIRTQYTQRHRLTRATEHMQHVSPFKSMPAVQNRSERKSKSGEGRHLTQEIFTQAKPKDAVVASSWTCPLTTYTCDAVVVPPFKEYISLNTNLLADNESKLLATPLILEETEENRQMLLEELPVHYEMKHDAKGPLDLRNEQVRFYKQSFEGFLQEVDMSWDSILYWLFAPDQILEQINGTEEGDREFGALLTNRSLYHDEEFQRDGQTMTTSLFDRDDKKCRSLFSKLRTSTAKELRLSAIIGEAFSEECNFSLWYMAEQSDLYQSYVRKKTRGVQADPRPSYRQVVCRVCHQHNCLFHGEHCEEPHDESDYEFDSDSSEDSNQGSNNLYPHHGQIQSRPSAPGLENERGSGSDASDSSDESDDPYLRMPAHWDSDSDVERVINYRAPMNSEGTDEVSRESSDTIKRRKPPEGAFKAEWWQNNYSTLKWNKRKPFYPCKHPGLSCDQARCRCYREIVTCEKSCQCSRSCNRRFPGCTCAHTSGKVCADKGKCLCIKFERECDADLCGSCGATDILDPVNRYNEDVLRSKCSNVAIQRGVPRKTLLGQSTVHGFGLYAGENIKKNDFIGEYKGEVISIQESTRRSTIYGYQQTMYLFGLNKHQDVDATHMGNKLRFINNADKKYTNCSPRNLLCNQVYRIALFASTNIAAGTELFFDYNYPVNLTATFKQPGQVQGSIVAVKDTVSKRKAKSQPHTTHTSNSSNSGMSGQGGAAPVLKVPSAKMIAGLKRARAAKALKAAAKRAELQRGQSLTATTLPDRTGPQRARKSVQADRKVQASSSRVAELRATRSSRSQSGRESSTSDTPILNTDGSDNEAPGSVGSHIVQDTDEEEDFIPDTQGTQDSTNSYDASFTGRTRAVVEESDDGYMPRRGPGRPRTSGTSTPVVAVRKKKKKMGGARPGAGRPKRKRTLVANSDDE